MGQVQDSGRNAPSASRAMRVLLLAGAAMLPLVATPAAAQDVLRYACEAAGVPLPGATQAA